MLDYKKVGFFSSLNSDNIQQFYKFSFKKNENLIELKTRTQTDPQKVYLHDVSSLNFDFFNLINLKFKFNLKNIPYVNDNRNFEKISAIVFLKTDINPNERDYVFYDIETFEVHSNGIVSVSCILDIFNSSSILKDDTIHLLVTQYSGNDDLIRNYFYTNLESYNKHQDVGILANEVPFLTSTVNGNHYIYPVPSILLYRATIGVDVEKTLFNSNCAIYALPLTKNGVADANKLIDRWGTRFIKAIIHPFGPVALDLDITSPSWGRRYTSVTTANFECDDDGIECIYLNGSEAQYKFNYVLNWKIFQKYKYELNEQIEFPKPINAQRVIESRSNIDSYWLHYGSGMELLKRPYVLQFNYTFNPTMKIYDEFETKEVAVGINFSFPTNGWKEFVKNNPTYYEQKKVKNIEQGINFGLSLINSGVGLAGAVATGNVAGGISSASSLIGSTVSFASQKKLEKLEIENKKSQYIFQNSDTFNTFSFMQDKLQDYESNQYNLMLLVHETANSYDFPIINAFQRKNLHFFEFMNFNYLKGSCLSPLQKPYLNLINSKLEKGVYIL